jgi:isopenicillin N synthase-like dioxygenase
MSFQKQTAAAAVAQHGKSDMDAFTHLPVLSLAAARSPQAKPAFLDQLRLALLHVGFLYLADTGLPDELVARVSEQTRLFFDESVLPLAEKEKIEMKNEKSFLGWSRVRTSARS